MSPHLDAMMQDPEIATEAPSNVMLIDYPIREFRSQSGCCDASCRAECGWNMHLRATCMSGKELTSPEAQLQVAELVLPESVAEHENTVQSPTNNPRLNFLSLFFNLKIPTSSQGISLLQSLYRF